MWMSSLISLRLFTGFTDCPPHFLVLNQYFAQSSYCFKCNVRWKKDQGVTLTSGTKDHTFNRNRNYGLPLSIQPLVIIWSKIHISNEIDKAPSKPQMPLYRWFSGRVGHLMIVKSVEYSFKFNPCYIWHSFHLSLFTNWLNSMYRISQWMLGVPGQ